MGFRTHVDSGNIAFLEYDEFMETLTVTFKNGAVYDYIQVPSDVAEEMVSSPSKTQYLRTQIIPNYEFIIKVKSPKKGEE